MRKFRNCILLIALVIFSFCGFVACGEGGGGGGGVVVPPKEPIAFVYDEKTGELTWNQVEGLTDIIVTINGEEVKVNGGSYNIKDLNLVDGIYSISVTYTYNNETQVENTTTATLGEQPTVDQISLTFLDYNNRIIKTIYKNRTDVLTQEDFPKIFDKKGVTYTWSSKVGDSLENINQITLSAEFERYAVTYSLNGGAIVGEPIEYYTIENKTVELSVPTKAGFKFGGWYLSSDFSGEKVDKILTSWCKEITLYAKFIEGTSDEKAVLEALTYAANAREVTLSIKQEQDNYKHETAYSLNDGIYIHEKDDGKNAKIIKDGKCYDYGEHKIYYALSGRENTAEYYLDPMDLAGMVSLLKSITKPTSEKGGFKTTATFVRGNDEQRFTIYYAEGKLTRIIYISDGVDVSIKYSVEKLTPSLTGLSLAVKVQLYLVRIDSLTEPPRVDVREDVFLNTSLALKDNEGIKHYITGKGDDFDGFYIDEELKTLATYDNINGKVYLKFIRKEIAIELTKFTLKFHCDCSECNGKVTTINNVSDRTEFTGELEHFKGLFSGGYYKIENGEIITGYFDKNGADIDMYAISQVINEKYEKKEPLDNLIFDIYTKKEVAETVKVTLHFSGDNSTSEYYIRKGADIYHEGCVPEGYFIDLEKNGIYTSTNYDTAITQFNTDIDGYIKTDKGITITIKLGKNIEIDNQIISEKSRLTRKGTEISDVMQWFYRYSENDITYMLTKLYHDENKTQLASVDEKIIVDTILYAEFEEEKRVNLIEKEGLNLIEEYSKTIGLTVGSNIYDAIRRQHGSNGYDNLYHNKYNDDFMYVSKFYTDKELTNEVTVYDGTYTNLYIGYVKTPTMTIICPDTCVHSPQEHSYKIVGGIIAANHDAPQMHSANVKGHLFNIFFYLDEECKTPLSSSKVWYEDFTIYGKADVMKFDITLHCHCLTHGEEGVKFTIYYHEHLGKKVFGYERSDQQGNVGYTKGLCDFGYIIDGENSYNNSIYIDEKCEERYDLMYEREDRTFDLYLPKTTIVNVYGGLGISEDHKVAMYDLNKIFSNHTNFNKFYWLYRDAACKNQRIIPARFMPKANDTLYFKENTTSGSSPTLTVKANGQSDRTLNSSNKYISYEGCFIQGYYYDKALTDPVEYTSENLEDLSDMIWREDATIYAKIQVYPVITFKSNIEGFEGTTIVVDRNNETLLYYVQDCYSLSNINFKEGHRVVITKTENGTDYVDFSEIVNADMTVYLRYLPLDDSYMKVTFTCHCDNPEHSTFCQNTYRDSEHLPIGKDNYIYIKNGDYKKDLKHFNRYNSYFMHIDGEKIERRFEDLTFYSDEACLNEITNFSSYSDISIHAKLDKAKLKGYIIHLDNTEEVFKFYFGGINAQRFQGFSNALYKNGYINYAGANSGDDYETFFKTMFANGVIKACYKDSGHTELLPASYEEKDNINVYCVTGQTISFYKCNAFYDKQNSVWTTTEFVKNSYLADLNLTYAETSLYDDSWAPIGMKYEYSRSLTVSDYIKQDDVITDGTKLYRVKVRNSLLEINVVCECGEQHHQVSMPNGSQSLFYVDSGTDIKSTLGSFLHQFVTGKAMEIKYYKDAEHTIEITDFTITADITIYTLVTYVDDGKS